MKRLALLVTILGSACGDDSRPGNPPKPPGGGSNEEGEQVLITTAGNAPMFIAYRDGAGEWLDPTEVSTGNYEVTVTGPYEVVAVCGGSDNAQTSIRRFSLEDGAEQKVPCVGNTGSLSTVKVSGEMLQAGSVFMGDQASSPTAPWTFELDVTSGSHDLIAFNSQKILFDRNLDIEAGTTITTVDLTAGAAFETKAFTFEGKRADDTLVLATDLLTANEVLTIPASGSTAKIIPADALATDDHQVVLASVSNGTAHRSVSLTPAADSPSTLAFPPRLSGVRMATDGATWASVPAGKINLVQVTADDAGSRQVSIELSNGWLAAIEAGLVATGELKFDLDIPGYDATWNIDPAKFHATLSVIDDQGAISYRSAVSQSINGGLAPATTRDDVRARFTK
ncbi:MAG: hypothetical protein WKG01_30990 [Kofleriaceae bacterium]